MKSLVLLVVPILALGGCQFVDRESVAPGSDSAPDALLLGHVPGGVPEGFFEDARDASEDVLRRYIQVSESITAQGGGQSEPMRELVTPEWWSSEVDGFEYFQDENLRTVGESSLSRMLVQSARRTPANTIEVGVIACVDGTDLFVVPIDTPDPPESVWDWHPHYEDFEGAEAQWAEIEAFLTTPGVSWGSPEAVVFWFEGPTMGSLALASSEPWWGVYPCE